MVFFSRKTRFHNRTRRSISIKPLRCSVGHEIEGDEIIIKPNGLLKEKATKFSFEGTIPDLRGFLLVTMVGTNHSATITAKHVRLCADIFFNGNKKTGLTITAITEELWDYKPFSWISRNNVERKEIQIYPAVQLSNSDEIV
ncbi:uncharacterized protein LOC105637693 isoform X2 [Jatropha curcas]|uniref:uncharacterized protein LOC105637693 isoform X2 n=1 Tax=Jatropha curcas TaxID=180498 RepID=UPI001893B297|nr:uncharacterized protein LOC105637693 isoform X2 [Jatropha curcas]